MTNPTNKEELVARLGNVTILPGVEIVPPERIWWRLWRRDGSHYFADQTEYDRLRALNVRKFVAAERAKTHRCSVCRTEGPWTEDWMWFGSYKDMDDGKPVQKFCSEACRKQRLRAAPESPHNPGQGDGG